MKNDTTITDFFYQLLSNRVSNKIRSSGKTYHQIYCASSKMLSWICSNTIYKKYNPYLITDSVMDSSYYDKSEGKYKDIGLIPSGLFKTKQEILWGTNDEIDLYLPDLYDTLFTYMESLQPEKYNKLLFAYRPYAKYYTLHKLLIEDPNTLAVPFLNEDYDKIDTNLIYSKNAAYKIIKQTCFDEFKQMFLSFTNEIVTYKKLNKTLQETLIPNFNLIFQDYVPSEGSISIRIIRELENLLDIPNGDTTYDDPIRTKKKLNIRDKSPDSIYRQGMLLASMNYINQVCSSQEKYCNDTGRLPGFI